ncbi:MAG: hypothetical protein AAGA61_03490, partial [Pseudomonadota bacterium]
RPRPSAEDLAFDKADEAASIEKIRTAIQQTEAAINALGNNDSDSDAALDSDQIATLQAKKVQLIEELKTAEAAIKAKELAEIAGDQTQS